MPSLPQPSDLSQTETKNETQDEIITLFTLFPKVGPMKLRK